jgi:hypothetical protein
LGDAELAPAVPLALVLARCERLSVDDHDVALTQRTREDRRGRCRAITCRSTKLRRVEDVGLARIGFHLTLATMSSSDIFLDAGRERPI